MDNNYAEQAIRPFTIARKNFVLIDFSKIATASAMLFSFVETAYLTPAKMLGILISGTHD